MNAAMLRVHKQDGYWEGGMSNIIARNSQAIRTHRCSGDIGRHEMCVVDVDEVKARANRHRAFGERPRAARFQLRRKFRVL